MTKKIRKFKIAALALCAAVTLSIIGLAACNAGADGKDGKSAYDIWLEQGNTGTEQDFLDSLKGDRGETPEIKVGVNGNWFVDGVDTGVKAHGDQGDPGKDGAGGATSDEGTVVDIKSGLNQEIPVNLSEGTHIIVADLGVGEFAGRVQAHVGDEVSELVRSESRSVEKASNIYYGYINVKEDTKSTTIYGIDADFKATINFEDYAMPTIEVGTAVEMPIKVNGTAADSQLKVKIGTSVQESTKYSISIIADSSLNSMLRLNLDGEQLIMITMYGDASKTTNLTINAGKLSTGEHYFSLIHLTGSSGGNIKAIYPALVTLTEAA